MKYYHYFVSYFASEMTFGMIQIMTDEKVSSFDDILSFRDTIAKEDPLGRSANEIIILNYHLISDEPY